MTKHDLHRRLLVVLIIADFLAIIGLISVGLHATYANAFGWLIAVPSFGVLMITLMVGAYFLLNATFAWYDSLPSKDRP